MEFNIISLILSIVAFLVAITVHEFAHAWTANYLGDDTAKHLGRVSLNPVVHFDPIGSSMIIMGLVLRAIGVPTFLFGWGKPVPVNPNRFKSPKIGWALVSFAGPLSNILLAIFFSLIIMAFGSRLLIDLQPFVSLNIFLAIFNLIPIPPLDGSKILYAILPKTFNIHQLETAGPFILLVLIFTGILQSIMLPIFFVVSQVFGLSVI